MKHLQKICFIVLLCIAATSSAQKRKPVTNQFVKIETDYGVMVFSLSSQTPKHTANFVKLAKEGYFNTYDFNRVLKGFVAQGGETDAAYAEMEKNGKVLDRIAPEFSAELFHQKGALAAGRDDNKEKTSFTGQFYIVDGKKYTDSLLNLFERKVGNGFHYSPAQRKIYKETGGTPSLDQNYTVFGQLIKGMDVFDKMMSVKANREGRPEVRIGIRVYIISEKEMKKIKTL